MNSTVGEEPSLSGTDNLGSPVPVNDIVIGALALLLALAAVVIAIVQLHRTRAASPRSFDPESAQIDMELSRTSMSTQSSVSPNDSVSAAAPTGKSLLLSSAVDTDSRLA